MADSGPSPTVALGAAGAHHPPLPHADKIAGFSHWLGGVLDDVVLGRDGSWMAPFVSEAGKLGRRRAGAVIEEHCSSSLESSTEFSILQPGGQRHYNSLAVSELRGIFASGAAASRGEYRPGRYVAFEVNDPKTAHRLGGAISGPCRTPRALRWSSNQYFKLASSNRAARYAPNVPA
jgi:hypothetical protein